MPEIHHEVFIAASAQEVYEALTTPEGLSGWWTPGSIAREEMDFVCRFPFGDNYVKQMRTTDFEQNRSVKWLCIEAAEEWINTTISFSLSGNTKDLLAQSNPEIKDQLQQDQSIEGTILSMQHANWKSYSPMFAECSYTWGRFMRSLKLYCETGKGTPWPGQHLLK